MPVHFPQPSGFFRTLPASGYPEASFHPSGRRGVVLTFRRPSDLSGFRPSDLPSFRLSVLRSFRPFVLPVLDTDITSLTYMPTDNQVADVFTKALPRTKLERFCTLMGLRAT
ncbi:hypothetical protein C8R45DRAFT_1115946 [Mycena sanguinolenta]|nr:hypothetical protein C8R45DRAFT_1115946 [Mycena sanguinolenta]